MEVYREPTPERLELLSLELEGVRRHILRIRHAMVREATGPNG
jgi:hypothetical protein